MVVFFYFPDLRDCFIKCSYISVRNGGFLNDNIWTLLFYLYLCHLLEFNSHLTGDPRSTEITNDYSPIHNIHRNKEMLITFLCDSSIFPKILLKVSLPQMIY